MRRIVLPARYYEQFGADYSLPVPGEGYGGWKQAMLPLDLDKTAVVVMHAWDVGTPEENPGVYSACEYIPRSVEICQKVLPPLLAAVRRAGVKLYHVVGGGDYYKDLPAYRETAALAGCEPPMQRLKAGEIARELQRFRAENVHPGKENLPRMQKGYTFAKEALPLPGEPVAENSHQLFALCLRDGVDHLMYAGFAINMCLLVSPGGMVDMSRRGLLCSAFADAVTAVENKETAAKELCKEIALWYLSVVFGFVYDTKDFIRAIGGEG